jgi:hypothetical protein
MWRRWGIILKWIKKEGEKSGLDKTGSGQEPIPRSCEHSNKRSGAIKDR